MKNNMKKKGFTLVELLVVIAIIAVLATVSIVGYTAFIKKANQSADQQAVTQMNTVLDAAQAGESLIVEGNDEQTSINIFKALIENGYNDEFVAYYEKYSFGYVVDNNKAYIVLVEDGKVAYPEKYEGKTDYKKFFEAVENSEQLKEALDTGYVLLKTDSKFSEALEVSNSVTIVGDNKVISTETNLSNDSSANSAFNVKGATEDVEVNLSGVNIENIGEKAYARGFNLSNNNGKVKIVLDDCDIESAYYALNIAGGNNSGVEIVIKNSVIDGWAALNVWSKVDITFENCTLIGNAVSNEPFATIVMNAGDAYSTGAGGSNLTFKNCTIEANNVQEGSGMRMLDLRAATNVAFEGCTFKLNGAESDLTLAVSTADVATASTVTIDGEAVDLTDYVG